MTATTAPARQPALPAAWRERYIGAMNARAIGMVEDRTDLGENRGQMCDYLSKRNGGRLGDYYCMHTVGATGIDSFGRAWPLLVSGSCEQQRTHAERHGALRTRAQFDAARKADPLSVAGWIGLCVSWIDDPKRPGQKIKHAHHTWVVGNIAIDTAAIVVTGPKGGVLTIEGNAADPKKGPSRNGDGIYKGRERCHAADTTLYEFIDPSAFPSQ